MLSGVLAMKDGGFNLRCCISHSSSQWNSKLNKATSLNIVYNKNANEGKSWNICVGHSFERNCRFKWKSFGPFMPPSGERSVGKSMEKCRPVRETSFFAILTFKHYLFREKKTVAVTTWSEEIAILMSSLYEGSRWLQMGLKKEAIFLLMSYLAYELFTSLYCKLFSFA